MNQAFIILKIKYECEILSSVERIAKNPDLSLGKVRKVLNEIANNESMVELKSEILRVLERYDVGFFKSSSGNYMIFRK